MPHRLRLLTGIARNNSIAFEQLPAEVGNRLLAAISVHQHFVNEHKLPFLWPVLHDHTLTATTRYATRFVGIDNLCISGTRTNQ